MPRGRLGVGEREESSDDQNVMSDRVSYSHALVFRSIHPYRKYRRKNFCRKGNVWTTIILMEHPLIKRSGGFGFLCVIHLKNTQGPSI